MREFVSVFCDLEEKCVYACVALRSLTSWSSDNTIDSQLLQTYPADKLSAGNFLVVLMLSPLDGDRDLSLPGMIWSRKSSSWSGKTF